MKIQVKVEVWYEVETDETLVYGDDLEVDTVRTANFYKNIIEQIKQCEDLGDVNEIDGVVYTYPAVDDENHRIGNQMWNDVDGLIKINN